VYGFRYRDDAERFYRVLPKRLEKFGLEVAPEKTGISRFSRFHLSMKRRFTFVGFEFYWLEHRHRVPPVKRRTSRKKLRAACRRIKEWIKHNRHCPGREFFWQLNARLQGHYHYYGVRGNSRSIYRFYEWAVECAFQVAQPPGRAPEFTWEQFVRVLEHVQLARARITEARRRRVFA
jgi:hypothetical protein